MLPLNLGAASWHRLEVLCIGAHCDDIEIGCGASILALQEHYPECRIHWLVLTSNSERREEAIAAARTLVKGPSRGEVFIGELPDGLLPAHFTEVKQLFEKVKRSVDPNLVFTHREADRHQDHSLVSQVTWQTFRDHMIWEYEIPKYEGDLVTPNMYVPLPVSLAKRKIDIVMRSFPSQASKSWFTAENLSGLMRLRGLECRSASGFAEAFHCRKLVFSGSGA
ncbi:PIG-L deacetylase family protein [Noviherbaspirillum massiliense]|uniref:PIG-L deacetylase family protein n=1 Tax=Noviherbaspirillum massiliense TaxID=1465823 RepID=UPI00030E04AE|nr:PIG-L deacetylase family protein [Noviherbaspirillum massiliense]